MSKYNAYPENFIWGVATSSYQIEGAPSSGGKGPSVWDTFSHTDGKIKNNDNGDIACNHFNLWPRDVNLMDELGINAYRFSISWPRIFPTGLESNPNQSGLDYYNSLVDALLEKNIIPFITLNHWDIPQGLGDLGGWTNRKIIEEFVKYSYYISYNLGDRVKHWITHNEPWCISHLGYIEGIKPPGLNNNWPKNLASAHHLLLSHGMAVSEIKNNTKQSEVGITLNLNTAIPASNSEEDQIACRFYDGHFNRLYLDPLYKKKYPQDVFKYLIEKKLINDKDLNIIKPDDLKRISIHTDFLGVNYYSRAIIQNEEIESEENFQSKLTLGPKTDFGWEVYPSGIYDLLCRLNIEYNVNKIYITENGCSYGDSPNDQGRIKDVRRIDYHQSHLEQIKKAIHEGIPCKGYFAWSLMDNFEWSQGFSQRFGLVWVDFKTLERIPKDSFYWYKKFISSNRIRKN